MKSSCVGVGRTGFRVGGTVATCFTGSGFNGCRVPVRQREPVFLVNPPKVNGATVVRRITTRLNINLISCSVARRAERDTVNLPFVIGGGCSNGRCSISRCAVDRVVMSICSVVRRAKMGRNVLFLSRVGYISRALTPTVLRFLRFGVFNHRHMPSN